MNNESGVLNEYIEYHEDKLNTLKGSGLKTKRGGNVVLFIDPHQLLKKLELIIGEILAGNTSIKMRNMGTAILDMLLKTIDYKNYRKNGTTFRCHLGTIIK